MADDLNAARQVRRAAWGVLDAYNNAGADKRLHTPSGVAVENALRALREALMASVTAEPDTPETLALAAEAERGYWCREPIGGGQVCGQLGQPVDPPTPDRIVLCAQHRKGWGKEL